MMRPADPVRAAWRAGRAPASPGRWSWLRALARIGFGLLPAVLGAVWLRARLDGWEAAGDDVTAQRLCVLVVMTAITAAIVTALVTLDRAISGDDPIVLLTLPLTPAERLWIAALRIVRDWRCVLVLTGLVTSAAALAPAEPFWAVALLGGGWIGFVAGGLGAIIGVVAWTRKASGWRMPWMVITISIAGLLVWTATRVQVSAEADMISSGVALVLALLAFLALTGRRAGWLGSLYIRAVQSLATPAGPVTVRAVPAATLLASRRGAAAAMIAKDVLAQGRDPFVLVRVVVTAAALPMALLLRQRDALSGWSDVQLMSCLAAALTIYSLVDTVPSPIGAEGERLTLWAIAPTSWRDLLIAKLVVFLPPLLLQGVVMVVVIGIWIGMSGMEIATALALAILAIAGPTTLLVLMSASDLQLDVPLESGMPTTLHEHMPHSPRRLWLLSGTVLLSALMMLAIWRLPLPGALLLLTAIDVVLALACWTAGRRFLESVIPPRPRSA
jgi:hypothetical protein